LRGGTAWGAARVVVLLLTLFGLVGCAVAGPGGTAAATRMSAIEIVPSAALLIILDCPAASDPDDDDPDVVADLRDGRCDLLGNGSGTIIDPSGLILTNAHVVLAGSDDPDDAFWIQVALTDDPRELPVPSYYARPIAIDPTLDLALLQIAYDARGREVDPDDLDLPALELADGTADLQLEDPIRLIGYPGVGGITVTVVESRVAGFHFDLENEDLGNSAWIKTNPAAGAGVSGGTAVNEAGELIGVPSAGFGTELRCVDLDGDGDNDPATECQAMTGEVQLVRPIEFVHDFLQGAQGAQGEQDDRRQGRVFRDPHGDRDDDDNGERDERGGGGETVEVEVAATLRDAETGEPLAEGLLVVLQAGVDCAGFDPELLADGDTSQIAGGGVADEEGVVVVTIEVEVGAGYSLIAAVEGYAPGCGDDLILAEDDDATELDLGDVWLEAA
jgi:S1-C subfamily serine protease